jgi:acyl-CoA synthetase (AMP-forming)/AMP-acid ligase II
MPAVLAANPLSMFDALNTTLEPARLPTITFVGEGEEQDWHAARHAGEIAQLAQALRARFAPGSRIALLYQTEPMLLLAWFAALHASLEPLIVQYPNAKQSVSGWRAAIDQAFRSAGLAGMACSPELEHLGLEAFRPLFLRGPTPAGEHAPALGSLSPDAAVLQMSSGTTGHRKPIRLTLQQIALHVRDYNQAIALGPEDRIVSWLPLYHDMGFIACFLMPLMLGFPGVVMDPMTWVRQPRRLFETIEKHRATICYMPNFGFEVSAKHASGRALPTMRRWISCSEPVQAATMERFAKATGTSRDRLSVCYAMAENIFAVTQGQLFETIDLNGGRHVSCGPPIPNVRLKIVEGEIWVRSPVSLNAYADADPIVDAEGFYPTGDLGELAGDALVVRGRKHDLVNVAGKKYFLHELDEKVAQVLPRVDGRAVAVARHELSLGTELPLFLIEHRDFYLRSGRKVHAALAPAIDLESYSVEFVPPGFLTKTSSGKFNRGVTLKNYEAAVHWQAHVRGPVATSSIEEEVIRLFGSMPMDRPVETLLDSLGLVSLEHLLSDAGLRFVPTRSLKELLGAVRERECVLFRDLQRGESRDHIAIVSLADGRTISKVTPSHLERLSEAAGLPVTLEHICLPPVPVLLSDLVFFDYFLPRERSEKYDAVVAALSKVRGASMVLVDDLAEFLFGKFAYPALNSRFERSAASELLVWRWQKYTQHHDELPISVVNLWGTENLRTEFIRRLQAYLGAPIFRIATLHSYAEHTAAWDFVDRRNADWTMTVEVDTDGLISTLCSFLRKQGAGLRRAHGRPDRRPNIRDLPHFCSMYFDRDKIDRVLSKFDRFCLIGIRSTAGFIRARIRELGKTYFETSNRNLRGQGYTDDDFDCVLQTGSWGPVQTSKPVFQLFSAGWDPASALTEVLGERITDPGWFHADPRSAPNELSQEKSVLWLLNRARQNR